MKYKRQNFITSLSTDKKVENNCSSVFLVNFIALGNAMKILF